MIEILGVVGMLLLIAAWIPAAVKSLQSGKPSTPPLFTAMCIIGSLFLLVYAISRGDIVFATLNAVASSIASINFLIYLKGRVK